MLFGRWVRMHELHLHFLHGSHAGSQFAFPTAWPPPGSLGTQMHTRVHAVHLQMSHCAQCTARAMDPQSAAPCAEADPPATRPIRRPGAPQRPYIPPTKRVAEL